jgi:ribosomal protein S27AE
MAMVPQASPPKNCPRCGGAVYRDYDNDLSCLHCGESVFVVAPRTRLADLPPPPPEGERRKRGRPRKHPIAA